METDSILWRFFSFGEELHPAGRPYWWTNRNRPVSTDINVIQYTLKGTLRYLHNRQETLVHKGQAFLFNYADGSEYGIRPEDRSYSCFWISLAGAGISEHWNQIRKQYGSVITDTDSELLTLIQEAVKTGSSSGEQNTIRTASQVHHFVMQLMTLLARQSLHLNKPVDQALARLRDNPYYPWSIKELVEEEGCSREHFFRAFRERYKTTPSVWLGQQRAKQARYLLQTTRLTVEDIALQCGFSGAHSLARTLRRIYQQGPTGLRP
jgi:AraC-like DNA-binding protein